MAYQNIMVAVDGSDAAEAAFNRVLKIAKENEAKLYIAHVVDLRNMATIEFYSPSVDVIDDIKNEREKLLAEYADKAKAQKVDNIETVFRTGNPKLELAVTIPEEYNIDLIVCGATGLNAIGRFLIGSVAEQIVRNATCDVLVVRDN
ncbi:universal stress protein UspA [Pueribacillus theae]|uniref:Universal stress protein n=1 Tax=Pueribacillus theae TaxID=2171751 RepID=A0A2U1JQW0_9BACI|nr:universal stress protein [Pueribacillus theae]PWA07522.1 universal stress protein UspA [Pueribacillus theae]